MKMTIEKFFRTLLAAVFAVGLATEIFAASPGELHYQGKVTNSAGVPLPDGTVNLVFSLWNAANGGVKFVGSDVTVNNVPIANGVFAANFVPPLATIQANTTVYLQVEVNGKVFDTPRQRLVAAPFALSIAGDSVRTAEIKDGEVALVDMNTTDVDNRYSTLGTVQTFTGAKTINANWVNTANPWADNEVSDILTVGPTGSVAAAAVQSGSLGAGVIASSIAVNAVTNPSIVSLDASKLTGVLPAIDGSALTGVTANSVAAADVQAGNLGGSVIASSIAVNAVTNPSIVSMAASKLTGALPAISGASLTNLTAANISAGSLGGSVIASSVAVNAVTNPSIVSLAASKLTGALPAIDGSALTGVTANSVAAADVQAGSLGGSVIASSIAVNAVFNPSIVSLAASKLTGALPAIDGSALTGVTANSVAAANVQAGSLGGSVIASSIAVNAVTNPSIVNMAASKLTGALPAISGASLTNLTAANISAGSLGGSVIASSIAVNAVTNPSIVSMAASKLTGALPAISGTSLTNLTAANISAGSLGGSVIASSVAVNSISNAQVAAGAAISASKIVGGTFGSGTDFQIAAGDSLGIGVAPSNTLQVNGPIATKIRSVSANTSLDATDSIVIVDTSGGNRTITLPVMDATTAGRELKIFNVGTNNLTIQRQGGSEKINNANSLTSTTRYEVFVVVGDGTDWWAAKLTP